MKIIKSPILPLRQEFAKIDAPHELDYEAICVFTAIGFFLDTDTYWQDVKVLKAAHIHTIDSSGILLKSDSWFTWHTTPKLSSFDETLEEYSHLFESIIQSQITDNSVILPLSGGLDSRTQAVALSKLGVEVQAYSYQFEGGYAETKIAEKIAKACDFEFKSFEIKKGYLWSVIDELAHINGCFSDFTHPRQMAVLPELRGMTGVFSLGHWGDVLFDSMNLPQLKHETELEILKAKLLKRGGLELAQDLWLHWDLKGDFIDYLDARLHDLLNSISIEDTNVKFRAFKSMYWAPRWTTTNLSVFEAAHPITVPYYDDRMCEFICTAPEQFLANRQLQLAYIKNQRQDLARITWQDHRPFNLNTYCYDTLPYNLPYRIWNKAQREVGSLLGQPHIQRNWELQFLGDENDLQLRHHLFGAQAIELLSEPLISKFYNIFRAGSYLEHAHPISMLLTIAQWNRQFNNNYMTNNHQ